MVHELAYLNILVCLIFAAVAVLSTGTAGFLAFQPPEFYTTLKSETVSETDRQAVSVQLKQMQSDFKTWHSASIALQSGRLAESSTFVAKLLAAKSHPDDATQDIHTAGMTEKELNAHFASGGNSFSDQWQDLRVRIGDSHLELGLTFVSGKFRCIPSL